MKKLTPLQDRVVIEIKQEGEKTQSGIVLPETADKERPEQGIVVSVGPGKLMKDGSRSEMGVKKGDTVLFSKYGPTEAKVDGKEYLVIKEEDILAIIEG